MTAGHESFALGRSLLPFSFVAASACVGFDVGDRGASPPASDCLIAHYAFHGDARDEGPNHLDGRLYGTPAFGPDPCNKPGSAYALNGTDSFVSLGVSPQLKPTNVVSVAAWFKAATFTPTYQNIVSDHAPNETSSGYAFILRFAKGTLQFITGGVYGLGTARYVGVDMSHTKLGEWHHVVGVYDGSSIRMYVDNVMQNSVPFAGRMNQNENPMLVGKSGFGELFAGSIADLRIYGCALDADEVASLYASGRCP